jgi:hypothetical protein
MILRRVIAHFRKQEWTAIFLDFIIVVVGVFVGLQVNNWNEAQAEQRRSKEYVERMIADLEVDLDMRRTLLAYYEAVNESAERAVELLSGPSPDPKTVVVNVYRASELAYDPQTRATWDEIVSSGEIGLLPRGVPASGLTLYFGYDNAEDAKDTLSASPYRMRVRRDMLHDVQKAIRAGCSDVINANGSVVGFQPECRLDVSDAEITAAAEALLNDPDLLPDLTLQFSILSRVRANLRGDVGLLTNILADLQDASGERRNASE